MKRVTIAAIQGQLPREVAVSILHDSYSLNPEMFAQTLFFWLGTRVTIVDEFEELLRGPEVMLQEIIANGWTSGDCDDCAMLSAAMLASVGAMTRFRAIEKQPDGSFAHVFCEYRFPRRETWQQFDITVGGIALPLTDDDLICDVIS